VAGETDLAQARQWLERALTQGLEEVRPDLAALPEPAKPAASIPVLLQTADAPRLG